MTAVEAQSENALTGKPMLIVEDNGSGITEEMDWKNSNTLGYTLVQTLVENQLDDSIDMKSENGTKFIIRFNIKT
jgi:two-component sensor histidine kinase